MNESDLKYILHPNATVYTQCFRNDEWIPNVVKDIDSNTIRINLSDYYFRKGVMVGDFISLRFDYAENEYILEGEIIDIDIYNTYTINIFINNINIYKNRRKSYRYYAKLGASLKTEEHSKGTYSIITNISLSGIALISKLNININSPVTIDLFVSSNKIIPLNGTVIRKRALNYGYEYGISVANIDHSTQEKLNKLIKTLENDLRHIC